MEKESAVPINGVKVNPIAREGILVTSMRPWILKVKTPPVSQTITASVQEPASKVSAPAQVVAPLQVNAISLRIPMHPAKPSPTVRALESVAKVASVLAKLDA